MRYFTVPTPPSVNKLFRNVPKIGRVKTKDYKDWIAEATVSISHQKVDPVRGRVVVAIAVERQHKSADIDNRLKALLDVLVSTKTIEDDRMVVAIFAAWTDDRGSGRAAVSLWPADEALQAVYHPDHAGRVGFIVSNVLEQ